MLEVGAKTRQSVLTTSDDTIVSILTAATVRQRDSVQITAPACHTAALLPGESWARGMAWEQNPTTSQLAPQ